MASSFSNWLSTAPLADPIERRQAVLLRIFALACTVAPLLVMLILFTAAQTTGRPDVICYRAWYRICARMLIWT